MGRGDLKGPMPAQFALRVAVLGGVGLAMFAIVFFRLWYLQVLSGDHYKAEAQNNQVREFTVQAPRGQITDRHGQVLVDNRTALELQVKQTDLPASKARRAKEFRHLQQVAGLRPEQIRHRIRAEAKECAACAATLRRDVPYDTVYYLRENQDRFPGVSVQRVFVRQYPQGTVAAHVLGYVGEVTNDDLKDPRYQSLEPGDKVGKGGVEYTYDSLLRGVNGATRVQVDASGQPTGGQLSTRDPQSGNNLVLTLDDDVQRAGQDASRANCRRRSGGGLCRYRSGCGRPDRRDSEETWYAGRLHRDRARCRLPLQGISMRQKKLLWRIYLYFFASTLITLTATAWYATHSLRLFHQSQVTSDLLVRTQIVAQELAAFAPEMDPAKVDPLCKELGHLTATRITVVLPNGTVIGDSEEEPARMENHRNRPEIATALEGETGKSVRFSDTIRRTLLYLAIPVRRDGAMIAALRASLPLAEVDWTLHTVYRHIFLGGAIAAALFAVVTFILSRRIVRPLESMRQVAEQLARGELSARIVLPYGEEMSALARTLNQMAAQLSERMDTITRQRNEQAAVFASMEEGVLAMDRDERILYLNEAAARLLELTAEQARGLSVQEAVRNRDLQEFIAAQLAAPASSEAEIVLYGNEERFLQLHGTTLTDASGLNIGILVVLNDITRLKRLETVRRDFVANVSHELKTPITAIKGCVETLADPATANFDRSRFLAMMARHVDRLGAIVEDLLSLSQIEFDAERGRIPLEQGPVCDILRRAVSTFTKQAEAKRISLAVECSEDLMAPLNAALLEQAVGNLLDNAIKYSGEGTRVVVGGTLNGSEIEIRVTDQGPGIEKKHLSRIFERFYRVDQARSRTLGGTGLGLAIVKHIALAHRGSVSVESTPGQGSAFTIRIPGL